MSRRRHQAPLRCRTPSSGLPARPARRAPQRARFSFWPMSWGRGGDAAYQRRQFPCQDPCSLVAPARTSGLPAVELLRAIPRSLGRRQTYDAIPHGGLKLAKAQPQITCRARVGQSQKTASDQADPAP